MSQRREPHDIDTLLAELPLSEAPDALWDGIQDAMAHPEASARALLFPRRPYLSRLAEAAAIVLAVAVGGAYGLVRGYSAPAEWGVSSITGVPTVAGATLAGSGAMSAGDWLVTDSVSAARLAIGAIGSAEVRPNSRVRLDEGRGTEHRLTLAAGSLYAFVNAPPRLFFIETPTALATDLGCAYVLEVDDAGVTRIWVTSGWVEFKKGDQVSLVSAGLVAEVGIDGVPGTPYPKVISREGQEAFERLDRGSNDPADLEIALASIYPNSPRVLSRQPTTIALWHLVQRLDGPLRTRAFEALAAIAPPPASVTREGILALDRPMLERWRMDLVPMWSEEDVPMVDRAARWLWEATVGRK